MKTLLLLSITLATTLLFQSCQQSTSLHFSSEPTIEDNFDNEWEKNNKYWKVATWGQNGAQMSPERCKTNEEGHIVITLLPGTPYKSGSLESTGEYGYGRWITRVRPSNVPGALNSVFIKDWDDRTTPDPEDDGTKFEVDIEFLTYTFGKDTGVVHLAIHLKDKFDHFVSEIPLNFNPSDEFHDWGFDITKDSVNWHLDGEIIETWKADFIIPENYEFFFNTWSMPEWIHGPTKDTANYHIDRIRFFELKD